MLVAEHQDGVASLNLSITVDKNALLVANQSANGDAERQAKVLDGLLGDLRPLGSGKFCHVAIDEHQRADIVDVGIEHHLIYVAGSQCLLVDDGAYVEALGHFDIVEVLDHGHSLAYTESLSSEAGQDVSLGIAGECHEGLGVLYAFLLQQTDVAAVAVDYHDIDVGQFLVELLAALCILLHYLEVHVVGCCLGNAYCRSSATHDDDVLDVGIMFLAHYLADIRDILAGGHEVGYVVDVQLVVTTRYQSLVSTLDGHDVVWIVRAAEVA